MEHFWLAVLAQFAACFLSAKLYLPFIVVVFPMHALAGTVNLEEEEGSKFTHA